MSNGNTYAKGTDSLASLYSQQEVSRSPKSIMQQLREKADELRANLAKVETWKAELAQAERMLAAAAEGSKPG